MVTLCSPTDEHLRRAAELLSAGELVAFPTETVYGLGANGFDARAVKKIYAAKGRPSDNPLILHFSSPETIERAARWTPLGRRLARAFMPGPLTLVLPALPVVPAPTRGGLDTVGCRVPVNETARRLLELVPFPLAAPSANRSGRPSPTDAQTVARDLGDAVALILDGGPCAVGVESTVVDVTGDVPLLLRPGGVTAEQVIELCGELRFPQGELERRRSPGTRYRHYAPLCEVLLWRPGAPFVWPEKFVYVGLTPPPRPAEARRIFPTVAAYAEGYYRALRDLEGWGLPLVAQWPGQEGLARALADRLCRSAGEQ